MIGFKISRLELTETKSHNKTMKKRCPHLSAFVIVLMVFGFTELVHAQKIKVKKVKGRTALIETSTPLEEGQSYDLQTSSISADVNYSHSGFKSRKNSFTFGLNFSALKGDLAQENSFSAQGRYGWIFSNLELGLVSDITYIDLGAGATTNFSGGGYFDYNLLTNRDSRGFIYGPFALLSIGSRQFSASGSAGLLTLNGGGFFSYFMNENSLAARIEAYVEHRQINASTGQGSLTGFGSRALLVFYF